MFDLSSLGKKDNNRVNKVAKEMFLDLINKQLTFEESLGVLNVIHSTLSEWGKNWLNHKYVTHIKKDLEDQGQKI